MRIEIYFIAIVLFIFASCEQASSPKPRGELRLSLPEHSYRELSVPCPFKSEIPEYSFVKMKKNERDNCWFNLNFPDQHATLHLTYKSVDGNLKVLVDEAIKLTYDHHIKADGISSRNFIDDENKVYGSFYEVSGAVASNTQFYITDSTNHFLRASLYFNASPNEDSLAPVTSFIREDLIHLIEQLRWED